MNFRFVFLILWSLHSAAYTQKSEPDFFEDVPIYTSLSEAVKNPLTVRRLSLVKAKLTQFPKEIFEFENLEELDLSRNNIRDIPPQIEKLKKLRVLNLSKNKIESMPEEIGKLKKLVKLDVSRNPLLRLPYALGECKSLEHLLVWDTNLSDLPASLNHLENLKEIDLRVILFSRQEMQRLSESFPKIKIHFSGECQCGPY